MRKNNRLLVLFLILGFIFYLPGCSNKNDSPVAEGNEQNSVLTNAELPPGKPVIEPERVNYENPKNAGALGNIDNAETKPNNSFSSKSRLDTLKQKFKNLLVFHADDTMQVNQPRLATLILANDRSITSLKTEVLEESEAKDNNFHVDTSMEFGSKMKARLISFGGGNSEKGFDIEPMGEDEQSFKNGRKKIIWQWKVTPLQPGQQSLKLSIQIIEKDGEAVSLAARNIDVIIFAKPENVWKQIGTFLEGHQWLFSVLLIPILVAWFTTRMKNKTPPDANNQTAKNPDDKIRTQSGKKRRR